VGQFAKFSITQHVSRSVEGTAGYPQGSEYFSESRKRVVIRPNPLKRNASLSFTEKIATILEKDNETTLFAGM
jgi:hypothetical protein